VCLPSSAMVSVCDIMNVTTIRRKTSRRSLAWYDVSEYFVVVLGLHARHELEELLEEVVVVFHPAELAEGVEVVVDDLVNVFVVRLLLVVVDVHHPEGWTLFLDCYPLVRARIGNVLYLNQEFVSFWHELVDLDWDAGHSVPSTGHVKSELNIAPAVDVLVDEMLEVRILVHLRDKARKEIRR
jgi:hypothetical protein